MNKKNDLAELIYLLLIGFFMGILIHKIAEAAAKEVVREDNSGNPILVFPEKESTPIGKPIYL
jgi:hypothetical protein